MTGGAGTDQFIYLNGDVEFDLMTHDVITDFVQGEDRINLSAIDADPSTPGDDAFGFNAAVGAKVTFVVAGGRTFVDLTSNGPVVTPVLEFELVGTFTLTAGDFIL